MWGNKYYNNYNYIDDQAFNNNNDGTVLEIEGGSVDREEDTNARSLYERIKKPKTREYSEEELMRILNDLYGSTQNVLQYCGIGTYLIAGPSNSGKTYGIRALMHLAQIYSKEYELRPVRFTCILLFSSTAELSDDWKWAKKSTQEGENTPMVIIMQQSDRKILEMIKKREAEIKAGAKKLGITEKQWASMFPIAVVIDDFVGSLSGTAPNSALSALASKARHLGFYVFMSVQSAKQVGPAIRKNTRAIIGFRLDALAIEEILKQFFAISRAYSLTKKILEHGKIQYQPVIFIQHWDLNSNEYNIQNKILTTPPFPVKFRRPIEWKEPNVLSESDLEDELEECEEEEEEGEEDNHSYFNIDRDSEKLWAEPYKKRIKIEEIH